MDSDEDLGSDMEGEEEGKDGGNDDQGKSDDGARQVASASQPLAQGAVAWEDVFDGTS